MGKVNLTESTIDGVIIQPLKQIKDDRGSVMHMLRADSPLFEQFGEVYFSIINNGVVKAWKKHKLMTQNLAVPVGKIKLVIYDQRLDSCTNGTLLEIVVGENNYSLIKIPPGVWYGFKGLSSKNSLIVNCTTISFDENEVERVKESIPFIPFSWAD